MLSSDSTSLINEETAVQRRRATMAEIRQRYPGLQRGQAKNAVFLAGYYAGAVPMSRLLYGNVVEIVTPGSHHPQGESSIMCADPQCQLCSPQRYASLAMPGYSPSFWQYQPGSIKVDLALDNKTFANVFGDTDMVSEKDEEKEYRVYIQGRDYPMSGYKYTMSRLRKALDGGNTPYRIAYYED